MIKMISSRLYYQLLLRVGDIHIFLEVLDLATSRELPRSCSCVLFSAPGAPTCPILVPQPHSPSTPIFQPACPILGHLLTPTPACGLSGPRDCARFLDCNFPDCDSLDCDCRPAASFTDRQSATLTLARQVGKCHECHYFEHSELNTSAHTMNITQISQQLAIIIKVQTEHHRRG